MILEREREREREREIERMKKGIVIKTIKREDIIGNDDEDFVLIGWQLQKLKT